MSKKSVAATVANAPDLRDAFGLAADIMTDQAQVVLAKRSEQILLAILRSPAFERQVHDAILESSKDIIAEEIARRIPEFEARVRSIVGDQFESHVARTVRDQLDTAIRDVRSRLAR